MKLNCASAAVRHLRLAKERGQWHPWFAWYPVRIGDECCAWLELVERRGEYWSDPYGSGWDYEYRAVGS
jgi:hypothetical protein